MALSLAVMTGPQSSSHPKSSMVIWAWSGCLAAHLHLQLISNCPVIMWSPFASFPASFLRSEEPGREGCNCCGKSPLCMHFLTALLCLFCTSHICTTDTTWPLPWLPHTPEYSPRPSSYPHVPPWPTWCSQVPNPIYMAPLMHFLAPLCSLFASVALLTHSSPFFPICGAPLAYHLASLHTLLSLYYVSHKNPLHSYTPFPILVQHLLHTPFQSSTPSLILSKLCHISHVTSHCLALQLLRMEILPCHHKLKTAYTTKIKMT